MAAPSTQNKPRICIIAPFAYPLFDPSCKDPKIGGAELQMWLLAKELEKRGYDLHVIVDDFGQADVTQFGNITLHKVALKYMGGSNWHLLPAWLKLLRVLWRINADVHIIKLPRSVMPPLGLYCRLRSKQLIFVGQIDNDVDLPYLRQADGLIAYWFYRTGMFFVTNAVAQNQLQANGFANVFGKPTSIIRNAVADTTAAPGDDKSLILWVGRNLPKKHPEIFAALSKELPNHRFAMIMAPDSQHDDTEYVELAKTSNNFDYLGFLPLSETEEYFRKSRVFVCSSDKEGFPNVFLQAWQARTAIVSQMIDPDNVIENNDIGRLSGTFEQMVSDIDDLMTNDDKWRDLVDRGEAYVARNHAIKSVADQYEKIFYAHA